MKMRTAVTRVAGTPLGPCYAARPEGRSFAPETTHLRVIMAMMGRREHYQPMKSVCEHGHLARFITDFWFPPDSPAFRWARAVPVGSREHLKARFAGELKEADVVALEGVGMLQHFGVRLKLGRRWQYKIYSLAGRRFAQRCVRYLDVPHTVFMGYASAALEALEHENRSGVLTVIDQIDPARTEDAVVLSEMKRHKSWVLHDYDRIPPEYFERLSAEWSAATRIIVNSTWTRSALIQQGVSVDKIRICPLAYKPAGAQSNRQFQKRSRLRVLWLGTLSLRKGIVYAIEAARRLEQWNVDFTFAGPVDVRLPALPANCTYIGRIPGTEVGTQYSSHDIFILPTLSDGFGLTQLEAMAHGLPVIATRNCGEVVQHGVSGLIVPPENSRSLADALLEISQDSGKLEAMSVAALRRAADFTPDRLWHTFRSCLA